MIIKPIRYDCFPLPDKDDDSFIETYENYLESIPGKTYFVEVMDTIPRKGKQEDMKYEK